MNIDWNKILLNNLDFTFALEIIIRTLIMFAIIIIALRLTGKKGVRQLSLFEIAIIIGLGSAAGDPMFNEDAAIIPALIVFICILLFYRGITYWASKSEKFESILEGDPLYIIENGMFVLEDTKEPTFAKDEFFAEMRAESIEHLGQVRIAILETNGKVSFYFYDDDKIKSGLPVLPKAYSKRSIYLAESGVYACTYCGNIQQLHAGKHNCLRCRKDEWVKAMSTARLA